MSRIQATGLTKTFGAGDAAHTVLDGIDLTIEDGELVAIMGPSGSGKSTLLYALSGMDEISSGTVHLDDIEITALSQQELAALRLSEMGFVFQYMHMLRNLQLLDNIVLPGFEAGAEPRESIVSRGKELMAQVGIADLAARDITQVSGGQLQRAAICRSLINQPGVLFGDEPSGALNAASAQQIMQILDDVNASGTTTVIVTHDPQVASRCRRVLMLADGKVRDERRLTPYPDDRDERVSRLEELTAWLATHGI